MDYSIAILDSDKEIKETAELHIVYAVDGSCTLLLANETVQIERAGIYLLNFREPARLEVPRGALTALLSIDYFALCGLYNRPQIRFTVSGSNQRYDELRSRIQSLLLAYAGGGPANVCRELGEFYLLLQLLLNHFQIPSSSTDAAEEDSMNRLFSFLHSDPRMDLTLNDLAAKMFLSPAAASRLFRKATGENFTEYRRRTRLDYVKKELETTQKSITKIAVETGFTSSSVFNRVFREEYGVTPSQYREQYRQAGPVEQAEEKNLEKVRRILENDRKTLSLGNVMTEQVRAKSGMHIPWKRWENKILNVGPIHFLQAANMQEHMLMLAERLNVEYIRVWNIFAPRLMIQKDSGGNYNFSFLDEILDFCVDHRLKLHLDLAQRRNVSLASEKSEIYSRDEPIELNWADTLAAFLGHIKRRYTEEVVSQWIFEMTFF